MPFLVTPGLINIIIIIIIIMPIPRKAWTMDKLACKSPLPAEQASASKAWWQYAGSSLDTPSVSYLHFAFLL